MINLGFFLNFFVNRAPDLPREDKAAMRPFVEFLWTLVLKLHGTCHRAP